MTLKGVGARAKDVDIDWFSLLPAGGRHRDLIPIAGPLNLEPEDLTPAAQHPIKQRT